MCSCAQLAPSRHVCQVGESSRTRRAWPLLWSNACLNGSTLSEIVSSFADPPRDPPLPHAATTDSTPIKRPTGIKRTLPSLGTQGRQRAVADPVEPVRQRLADLPGAVLQAGACLARAFDGGRADGDLLPRPG